MFVNSALGVRTSYKEFNKNQITHKSKPNVANDCQEIKKKINSNFICFFSIHRKYNKEVQDFMILTTTRLFQASFFEKYGVTKRLLIY